MNKNTLFGRRLSPKQVDIVTIVICMIGSGGWGFLAVIYNNWFAVILILLTGTVYYWIGFNNRCLKCGWRLYKIPNSPFRPFFFPSNCPICGFSTSQLIKQDKDSRAI